MPINFDLDKIRKKYNCINYFETGLWDPRTNISCKKALKLNFKKVYCIEIRKDWVDLGRKVFHDYIKSNKFVLINDDSNFISKYITNDDFKEKTLFFFDAHVDNINIKKYINKCPIFNELEAIKKLNRNDNIICIDDLRILKTPFPWGETTYGYINFVDKIKHIILSINPNYKFTTLDGYIKDDVLMAYI